MRDLESRDPSLIVRAHLKVFSGALLLCALALVVPGAVRLLGQGPALTVLSRDGRRTIPITTSNNQDLIALEDLAGIFQLTVREEGGGITVSYRGRTIALTPDQTIASVAGRVISLPAPLTRSGGRWMVPLDFITRALVPIYDGRLELRRLSRLLIAGDLRVPRVSIQHETVGGGARVTIESTPRATATVTQESASRVLVHFDADAIDLLVPSAALPGFVQAYRATDATTVAVDLGPRVATTRSATQIVDAATRIVVDLLTAVQEPAAPPPATTTQAEPRPPAPDLPPRPTIGTSAWTITLDAGHGGDDSGAKGAGGTAEKNVTLAVARRVRATIEARLGYRVIMTRDDDRLVPVADRTALANNNKSDLFISLHANSSFRATVAGAAVYVAAFDQNGPVKPHIPVRLPAFGGGFRDLELVPWNLAQIRHKDQSAGFAGLLVDQFRDRIPLADASIDAVALRVLESANMPAVLIELGYLSNAAQEKQLINGEFQGVVAQAIADAIAKFSDLMAAEGGR
jgi:N-acetylmuramoyl-L-alanine amidase